MLQLCFYFEIFLSILRYFTYSTCELHMYTILEVLIQIVITISIFLSRQKIITYFQSLAQKLLSSFYIVLEIISLLDIENSRHTHMRYTSQYTELFGVQKYLYKDLVTEKGYISGKSNWFIMEVIKRETSRYILMCLFIALIIIIWRKTRKTVYHFDQKYYTISFIVLITFSIAYYLDFIQKCVPGYWPYLRSIMPIPCSHSLPQQRQNQTPSNNSSLLIISLESFSAHYLEEYPQSIPFITSLLSSSIFFKSVYSHSIPTANSVFSLFSSLTAPQRTAVAVAQHNVKQFPFFSHFQQHQKTVIMPFLAEFDKQNIWFKNNFDTVIDGISIKNKYKWKPDRISREEAIVHPTTPFLTYWMTAEVHYPFQGFDDEHHYNNSLKGPEKVLNYLDRQVQYVVENTNCPILILADHGSGFNCKHNINCKFQTFASIVNVGKPLIIDQTVTQNHVIRYLMKKLYDIELKENNLFQDGFDSFVLENGAVRRSRRRERWDNDCRVRELGQTDSQFVVLQICRLVIYVNYVYILMFIIEEVFSKDGAVWQYVVKQIMEIV